MTDTLPDLRDRLAARATASPVEVAAARARLEGRMVRAARPARRARALLVAAVAAVVLGVVSGAVVAVVHERPGTGPAAAGPDLSLSDWLFTVRADALPADLDVVEYVRATRDVQIAAVLRPGDAATSNHFSALVELAADPAELGVATRPSDAVSLGGGAWSSRHPGDEYGISGVQLVWTDPAGYTARVIAADDGTARVIREATTVGTAHPVRFPVSVDASWFPAGSTVSSVEFLGTQGVEVSVDVPDAPQVQLTVAAPGVFIDDGKGGQVATKPFAGGFSAAARNGVQVLHSSSFDLSAVVLVRDGTSQSTPVAVDRLRTLVAGLHGVPMTLFPDTSTWLPLVDCLPIG